MCVPCYIWQNGKIMQGELASKEKQGIELEKNLKGCWDKACEEERESKKIQGRENMLVFKDWENEFSSLAFMIGLCYLHISDVVSDYKWCKRKY